MSQFNGKPVSRRVFLKALSLATVSAVVLSNSVKRAKADIPTVLTIENISQDSQGKISLEVRHAVPSSFHYVNLIEVDVAGQVKQFTQQPQASNPFTVELDLGEIQGTPNVRARARCNLHGWSAWSTAVIIPEFSSIAMTLSMALAASLFILRNAKKT